MIYARPWLLLEGAEEPSKARNRPAQPLWLAVRPRSLEAAPAPLRKAVGGFSVEFEGGGSHT